MTHFASLSSAAPSLCTMARLREEFVGLKVLLIDNYDSFTYNLYQYMSELGATVHVVRNDQITVEECAAYGADRIMLSPGPGNPDEAGVTIAVLEAFAGKVPIFGVCLVRFGRGRERRQRREGRRGGERRRWSNRFAGQCCPGVALERRSWWCWRAAVCHRGSCRVIVVGVHLAGVALVCVIDPDMCRLDMRRVKADAMLV